MFYERVGSVIASMFFEHVGSEQRFRGKRNL